MNPGSLACMSASDGSWSITLPLVEHFLWILGALSKSCWAVHLLLRRWGVWGLYAESLESCSHTLWGKCSLMPLCLDSHLLSRRLTAVMDVLVLTQSFLFLMLYNFWIHNSREVISIQQIKPCVKPYTIIYTDHWWSCMWVEEYANKDNTFREKLQKNLISCPLIFVQSTVELKFDSSC